MPPYPIDQCLLLGMAQEMAKLASVGSVGLHREPPEQLAWHRKMSQLPEEDQAKLAGMMQVLVHGVAAEPVARTSLHKTAALPTGLLSKIMTSFKDAPPLMKAFAVGLPAYSAYQMATGEIGPAQGLAGMVLPFATLPMYGKGLAGMIKPTAVELGGGYGGSWIDKNLLKWQPRAEEVAGAQQAGLAQGLQLGQQIFPSLPQAQVQYVPTPQGTGWYDTSTGGFHLDPSLLMSGQLAQKRMFQQGAGQPQ